MIAERPMSGWSTRFAKAPLSIAAAAPRKPYTSSVASTWPASAARTTTRGPASDSATKPTTAKPSSEGSHGRSATTPLVSSNQSLPSETALGLAARSDNRTQPARFAAVTPPATAVTPQIQAAWAIARRTGTERP
jgi:hypothetical protein